MIKIDHKEAIILEHLVCKLYKCERYGISGLADADILEYNPLIALILVISYIYANDSQISNNQYQGILNKYEIIFKNPDENNIIKNIQDYINDLSEIIDKYL